MAFNPLDITIQLPPSAWSQMAANKQEGEHTASPPLSPVDFERSKSEQAALRNLEKTFGKKFGPNDPTPNEEPKQKQESKKQYNYDSPVARPTPRTTPNVSPQKSKVSSDPKQVSPLPTVDENVSVIFDSCNSNSPVIPRRPRVAPTPHHTPVSPDVEKVKRVGLGQFKPRTLFQNNTNTKV